MDFSLTEEQELMIGTAKQFAIKELRPVIRYIEENSTNEQGHAKAIEVYKKASKLGLTAMGYSPQYGGIEANPITMGLIAETLCRYGGVPKLQSSAMLYGGFGPGLIISNYGTKEQKEEWIPKLIAGDAVISIGATEPHCGSDATQLKTTAVKDGGEYVINGEKQMASGIRWSDAHLVFCRTSNDPGSRGISAIIVKNDCEGISKYHFETLGGSLWEIGGIVYKDVRVPVENLVGQEGMGFRLMMGMFDWLRALCGAECVGMAQGSLDENVEYVKQRTAFGQPIGKWEAVQFRISEAATMLEAARWLTYRALWLASVGKPHTKESAMVKWWVPKVTFDVVNDCIQNKGATGYTTESLDELKLRYIRAYWITEGTIDIQKIVIARDILGKEFIPYRK